MYQGLCRALCGCSKWDRNRRQHFKVVLPHLAPVEWDVSIPAVPGRFRSLKVPVWRTGVVARFLLPLRVALFRCWINQYELGIQLIRMVLLYSTTSQAATWPLGFPGCKVGPLVLPVKVSVLQQEAVVI